MLIQEISTQNLSVAIAHYVYRNTRIEDFHSEDAIMNASLYALMHDIVESKIACVRRFLPLLRSIETPEAWNEAAAKLHSAEAAKEFACFSAEVLFKMNSNAGWDAAKETEQPKDEALADYILGGAFVQGCREGWHLTDDVMRRINRDINDRVYTLLIYGWLEEL